MKPLARMFALSAAFMGSNIARAGIGFGLTLVLARGLGADRFGQWVLCTTWASTLTVVSDLGLGVLLTRDGAHTDLAGSQAWRQLVNALWLRIGFAVPLGFLLLSGASSLATASEPVAAIRLGALLGVVGATYGCFGAMFRSQPRWVPTVLGIEVGWMAVQLVASWWPVHVGEGVIALMMTAVAVQIAQLLTAGILWRPVFGGCGPWKTTLRDVKALLRRAVPFAAGLVANVETRIGPLMLGSLATPAAVGLFAAASRVGRVARLLPQAMFAGALPVLSQEHSRDPVEAQRVFRTFNRSVLAFAGVAAALCVWLAPLVLAVVYGPSFKAAAPALIWVGLALIPALANSSRKILLYAVGGEAHVIRWSAAGLLIQVALAAILIPAFGATGAAASLAVSEAAIWLPLRRRPMPRSRAGLHFQPAASA